MKVSECVINYSDEEEYKGTLELTIVRDEQEYELEFDFEKRSHPPHVHSPFPSPDKEIYAWPASDMPDELVFLPEEPEARQILLGGIPGLPDGINLLPKPYSEVESGNESPFIDGSDVEDWS